MKSKLDKDDKILTTDNLRGEMRRFYNSWERHCNLEIPSDVKRSMAPVSVNVELDAEAQWSWRVALHRKQLAVAVINSTAGM